MLPPTGRSEFSWRAVSFKDASFSLVVADALLLFPPRPSLKNVLCCLSLVCLTFAVQNNSWVGSTKKAVFTHICLLCKCDLKERTYKHMFVTIHSWQSGLLNRYAEDGREVFACSWMLHDGGCEYHFKSYCKQKYYAHLFWSTPRIDRVVLLKKHISSFLPLPLRLSVF